MADEGQVIGGINWRQTFPFTHIFRSFRIAIHLSKLALGLALLLSVYFGGRILDWAWPTAARAAYGEIGEYEQISSGNDQITLGVWRDQTRKSLDDFYAQKLIQYGIVAQGPNMTSDALDQARTRQHMGELKGKIEAQRDQACEKIQTAYDDARKAADDSFKHDEKAHADALEAAWQQRSSALQDVYSGAATELQQIRNSCGQGLFDSFFQYEIRQVNDVVDGVLHNDWLSENGVRSHVYDFFAVGPVWLIWNHTVFFIIFAIFFLVVWALFGGAISRIAAVHVARDEKISLRQAMNFAVGKLLSFASAPVIPLAIVIVIGLIVTITALILNIPFIGPLLGGAAFILALLAGFVMTLVLLGTAGGFNLMYPTIAVEGSDSFDAISRSFSYVYARPWRMLFYTAVAVAYGAATYVFVHMFIWMTLVLTHHFVGLGVFAAADNSRNLFSAMWPNPGAAARLSYRPDYAVLGVGARIGAFCINCWVMLLVSFLGAFAISLYFSANTIIYYLMRSEVDATEMDDVYLEQTEEEVEASLTPGAAGVTVTSETTIVTSEAAPGEAAPGGTDAAAPPAGDAPPPQA